MNGQFNLVYRETTTADGIWFDLTRTLKAGFAELGVRLNICTPGTLNRGIPSLVMTPHLYSPAEISTLPAGSILYNWEPLFGGSGLVCRARMQEMSRFVVWDYSLRNLDEWRGLGVEAVHVPLGYHRVQEIRTGPDMAFPGLLFFGAMNERRRSLLDGLVKAQVPVLVLSNLYGESLRGALAAVGAVVNVHARTPGILELPRLMPLWASSIPVFTELNQDTEVAFDLGSQLLGAPYEHLLELIVHGLRDWPLVTSASAALQETFRRHPVTSALLHGLRGAVPVG